MTVTEVRARAVRGVARGSAANLGGAAVAAAANLGLTILVTRSITRGSAGTFFSTTSLFLLATTLGALGTNTALVYFVARSRALGQGGLAQAYFRAAAVPVVGLGIAMGVLLVVGAPTIAGWLGVDQSQDATMFLRGLAVFIPCAALESIALAGSRGLASMRANVLVEQLGRPFLQLVLVAGVLAVSAGGLLGLAWAAPYAPAAVVAYVWWRRDSLALARRSASVLRPPGLSRDFWRFSCPRAIASVGQVVIQRLDVVLVAALSSPAEAAVYTAATRFLVVGQMGNRAISTAVQPRLATSLAREDRDGTNHFYRLSTAWLIVLTWPLYLMVLCFGPVLLTIFGPEYETGGAVVTVLALSMLLASGCGMVDMILTMGGRTSWNLANVLAGLGVNVGLDLWLIPSHGMLGAAIGWAVSIVTQNLLAIAQTGLVLGLHPLGHETLTAAVAAVGCFGVVGFAARLAMGDTWSGLLVSGVIATAAYAILLRCSRRTLALTALMPSRHAGDASGGPQ